MLLSDMRRGSAAVGGTSGLTYILQDKQAPS